VPAVRRLLSVLPQPAAAAGRALGAQAHPRCTCLWASTEWGCSVGRARPVASF